MKPARERHIGAGVHGIELAERIQGHAQTTSLIKAVMSCDPGSGSGPRNKTWELGLPRVIDLAARVLVQHESVGDALDAVLADAGDKPKSKAVRATRLRSAQACIKRIRSEYKRLEGERIAAAPSVDAIINAQGDLPTQHALFCSLMLSRIAPMVASMDFGAMPAKDRHVLMRFMEATSDAAKTQADVRLREANIEQIRVRVEQLLSDKPKAERENAADEIVSLFEQTFGIKIGGDA